MDEPKHEEVQELMEDVAKEIGYEWNDGDKPRRRQSSDKGSPKRSWTPVFFIIAAIIALSLIIQWAAKSRTSGQYNELKSKLEAIENRLALVEQKLQAPSNIASKVNNLESQVGGLETSIGVLSARLDKLTERRKKSAGKARSKATIPRNSGKKIYRVRKGDTLYGVAKKYGIKVASLCKANGLTLKSVLHPGQKLVIPAK